MYSVYIYDNENDDDNKMQDCLVIGVMRTVCDDENDENDDDDDADDKKQDCLVMSVKSAEMRKMESAAESAIKSCINFSFLRQFFSSIWSMIIVGS